MARLLGGLRPAARVAIVAGSLVAVAALAVAIVVMGNASRGAATRAGNGSPPP